MNTYIDEIDEGIANTMLMVSWVTKEKVEFHELAVVGKV